MVAFPSPPSLTLFSLPRWAPDWPAPVLGAVAGGVASSALAILLPASAIESLVVAGGLPAILAVAEPPLGLTARALLALGGGALVAAVTWSALYLLVGPDGLLAGRGASSIARAAPALRRADAHPDAPPRWPLSASDLGPPMPPPIAAASPADIAPPAELPLPADLDTPLAALDPAAIPASPREPVRPVEPLLARAPAAPAAAMAPGERLEVFALTPMNRNAPPPPAPPVPAPSIAALLERLERGVARREPAQELDAMRPSLEETLGSLRRLATRR